MQLSTKALRSIPSTERKARGEREKNEKGKKGGREEGGRKKGRKDGQKEKKISINSRMHE